MEIWKLKEVLLFIGYSGEVALDALYQVLINNDLNYLYDLVNKESILAFIDNENKVKDFNKDDEVI